MPILAEHKEILMSQSINKTLPEWYEYFNRIYSKNSIYGFCYKNKCPIKKLPKEEKSKIQSNNARKYNINQDYFKTWNRNMAYILGLWFADGCIYGGKMFDITLHKKDKYILKKIAKELDYEGNLYDYVDKQASRINFSCVVIYNDIVALGGKERKSNDIEFPIIPKEFLSDFIRGYFDGDGCIYTFKPNDQNLLRARITICGTKNFLLCLQQRINEDLNIGMKQLVDMNKYGSNVFNLVYTKNKDIVSLYYYMYKDATVFLTRKKNKFDNFFKQRSLTKLNTEVIM